MMPNPEATWGDAKNTFLYRKSMNNLLGGKFMGLTEEQIMSMPDDVLILKTLPEDTEDIKDNEGE